MKKETKNAITDILLYIIIYVILQIVIVDGLMVIMSDRTFAMSIGMLASSVAFVVAFALMPFTRFTIQGIRWLSPKTLLWVMLIAISSLLPSTYAIELADFSISDAQVEVLQAMMNSTLGAIAATIMVPLCEEILFRGAILGRMLRVCRNPWIPIVVSALCFGVAHGNLAQGSHAFLIGIFLGWLYVKTGGIWSGFCFHLVNNGLAVVLTRIFPESEDNMVELFGGDEAMMFISIGLSLVVLCLSLYQLVRCLKNKERAD